MLLTSRYYLSLPLLILLLCKAEPSGAQPLLLNRQVTITVTDMPVASLIQLLSTKTGIRFSYDPEMISSKRKVTVKVVNQPIGNVLKIIFNDPGVGYHEIGNQLVIYRDKAKETDSKPLAQEQKPSTGNPGQPVSGISGRLRQFLPDTVFIKQTDTLLIYRTDTLTVVNTETFVQHDTIRRTDTIYLYKTRKAGRNAIPGFDKNSVSNQKFREHNGFYTGISYSQLIGNAFYKSSSSAFDYLASEMKNATSGTLLNHSVDALFGYDYLRLGVRSGITYTRLGESFEYSFTRQTGGLYKTDTVETYYTVSGPDTSYYYVTDSSWVNIENKKFAYKNPNSYHYIEIPLTAKFRILQGDIIELYVLGGVITGLNIGSKALLIQPDPEQSVDWMASSTLNPILFSWQAGLGTAFTISEGIGILIELSYRKQMTAQFKEYPLEKKFGILNIKTGIFVRL